MSRMNVSVGRTALKNPLIAGSAEHHDRRRTASAARCAPGVGAVVVKSINESERGRDQLQRARIHAAG